jgi:hypothetical protein
MKIALIIENSQAAKSGIVHDALTSVAEPLGHQVHHYGMYSAEDKASLTYVMNGLLAGILINSKAGGDDRHAERAIGTSPRLSWTHAGHQLLLAEAFAEHERAAVVEPREHQGQCDKDRARERSHGESVVAQSVHESE